MSDSLAGGAASPPAARGAANSSDSPRRVWLVVPIAALFLSVFVGGHAYIAHRLVIGTGLPGGVAFWGVAVIVVLAATLIAQPIAERYGPDWIERLVVWPASLWMGVAFLLLMALMLSDLLLLMLGVADGMDAVTAERLRAGAVVALVVPTALIALRRGLALPEVMRLEIGVERWPAALAGFRIVQISDIHFGPILDERFAAWLVYQVNGLEPDLIAITGDLVDGRVRKVGHTIEPLAELSAPLGAWFVTGNHDHYSYVNEWVGLVKRLGIEVLRNEHRTLDVGGASFVLAGVDDHRSRQMPGEGGEDLDAALDGVPDDRPVVLLAHDPTTFRRASRRGVDLQLSGHTHGGQIWPFNYFVRLAVPWVAGPYRRGRAQLYVSRGTGFWGPPMRLGAPAEITDIVIRSGPGPWSQ